MVVFCLCLVYDTVLDIVKTMNKKIDKNDNIALKKARKTLETAYEKDDIESARRCMKRWYEHGDGYKIAPVFMEIVDPEWGIKIYNASLSYSNYPFAEIAVEQEKAGVEDWVKLCWQNAMGVARREALVKLLARNDYFGVVDKLFELKNDKNFKQLLLTKIVGQDYETDIIEIFIKHGLKGGKPPKNPGNRTRNLEPIELTLNKQARPETIQALIPSTKQLTAKQIVDLLFYPPNTLQCAARHNLLDEIDYEHAYTLLQTNYSDDPKAGAILCLARHANLPACMDDMIRKAARQCKHDPDSTLAASKI